MFPRAVDALMPTSRQGVLAAWLCPDILFGSSAPLGLGSRGVWKPSKHTLARTALVSQCARYGMFVAAVQQIALCIGEAFLGWGGCNGMLNPHRILVRQDREAACQTLVAGADIIQDGHGHTYIDLLKLASTLFPPCTLVKGQGLSLAHLQGLCTLCRFLLGTVSMTKGRGACSLT